MDTEVTQKLVATRSTTPRIEVTKGKRWHYQNLPGRCLMWLGHTLREVGNIAVLGEHPWGHVAAPVRSQKGHRRPGALCSCWKNAPSELDLMKHIPPLLLLASLLLWPPRGSGVQQGARWQRSLRSMACVVSASASQSGGRGFLCFSSFASLPVLVFTISFIH